MGDKPAVAIAIAEGRGMQPLKGLGLEQRVLAFCPLQVDQGVFGPVANGAMNRTGRTDDRRVVA